MCSAPQFRNRRLLDEFTHDSLRLQFEGHADLVPALVEVLAVDDCRQGEGDA